MAVQNFCGDAFRGATWVALHNGGGTGWGEAMNGGFGLVLDGSADAEHRARMMLAWDVTNGILRFFYTCNSDNQLGIARRAWARNENAEFAIQRAMKADPTLQVTFPHHAEDAVVEDALLKALH